MALHNLRALVHQALKDGGRLLAVVGEGDVGDHADLEIDRRRCNQGDTPGDHAGRIEVLQFAPNRALGHGQTFGQALQRQGGVPLNLAQQSTILIIQLTDHNNLI